MNEDMRDPVVTDHYREMAAEKAPEALNQAVLREARQQSVSRYSKSVAWLRPMAWAASIGLCLAVVLELNDLPQPEPSMTPVPASVPAPARAQPAEEDATKLDSTPGDAAQGVLAESMEQRARKSVDAEGRVSLDDLAQLEKAETDADSAAQRDDFAAVDAPALDELETLSRMREGSNTSGIALGGAAMDSAAAESVAADRAADGDIADLRNATGASKQAALRSIAQGNAPAMERAIDPACVAADRETPDAWLRCIQGLETDGLTEIAARERKLLQESFPEFEIP